MYKNVLNIGYIQSVAVLIPYSVSLLSVPNGHTVVCDISLDRSVSVVILLSLKQKQKSFCWVIFMLNNCSGCSIINLQILLSNALCQMSPLLSPFG